MHSEYMAKKQAIRNIIKRNVKPTNVNGRLNQIIYYKISQTLSMVMSNNLSIPQSEPIRTNVVYQYQCPDVDCEQLHIGMTTTTWDRKINDQVQGGAELNVTELQLNYT